MEGQFKIVSGKYEKINIIYAAFEHTIYFRVIPQILSSERQTTSVINRLRRSHAVGNIYSVTTVVFCYHGCILLLLTTLDGRTTLTIAVDWHRSRTGSCINI